MANRGEVSYFMGLNQFSDLSDNEWIAAYLSGYHQNDDK